jgi:hypothetical protein
MSTQIPTPSDFPMKGPTPEMEDVDDDIHVPDDKQPEIEEPDDDFPNR